LFKHRLLNVHQFGGILVSPVYFMTDIKPDLLLLVEILAITDLKPEGFSRIFLEINF